MLSSQIRGREHTHSNKNIQLCEEEKPCPRDDLEKKLRLKTAEEFGGNKEGLTEALEATLENWVEKRDGAQKKRYLTLSSTVNWYREAVSRIIALSNSI